jgi:DNA-binding NarL/FixJ family response regulator
LLIVLADKDPYDLDALRSALDAPDREILTVADGANVVVLAAARSPDVVIVAASIGRMGGFAVSRQLKTMADTGEIREPVVIVLLERDADGWVADWSRCDAYLTKPADPLEVDELVRKLTSQGAPAQS